MLSPAKVVPIDAEFASPQTFEAPQNPLLSQILTARNEAELFTFLTKLRGMLEDAAKDTQVDELLASRGVKKRKRPTDIPKKEFLNRCRAHREDNLFMWSREVRKVYQQCLLLIDAQTQRRR